MKQGASIVQELDNDAIYYQEIDRPYPLIRLMEKLIYRSCRTTQYSLSNKEKRVLTVSVNINTYNEMKSKQFQSDVELNFSAKVIDTKHDGLRFMYNSREFVISIVNDLPDDCFLCDKKIYLICDRFVTRYENKSTTFV